MTNEERARREQIAMNEQMAKMYAGLEELRELLGDGCVFVGTVDDYLDGMCGKIEENKTKAEDKENA